MHVSKDLIKNHVVVEILLYIYLNVHKELLFIKNVLKMHKNI